MRIMVMMNNKVLFGSLLFLLQISLSFANDESYGSVYKFILSKSVIPNEYEDFATTIAVYSLIVTLYLLCCYKRKS